MNWNLIDVIMSVFPIALSSLFRLKMKMHNNKTPCEFQNQEYLRKFVATGQLVETIEEKHVLVIDLSKAPTFKSKSSNRQRKLDHKSANMSFYFFQMIMDNGNLYLS